jgi:acyl carrier protein
MTAETKNTFMEKLGTLFGVSADTLTQETRLREDLNTKSMQYMAIAGTIQQLSGKRCSYSKVHKCATIGELLNLLDEKLTG